MKQRSRSLPLLVLVAVMALVLGSIGTATAAGLTTSQVKKIAKKQAKKVVKKMAPGLSVASAANANNATLLNGQPSSAYLNQAYRVSVTPFSGASTFVKALPAIPAGNYMVSVNVNVSSGAGPFFCGLSPTGGLPFTVGANGSVFGSLQTVSFTTPITVSGALSLFCQSGAAMTAPFPGTAYGPNVITFQPISSVVTSSTARGDGGAASVRPGVAPGR